MAFYSPDHPIYQRNLVNPSTKLPGQAIIDGGWAALCFGGDEYCAAAMLTIAAGNPRVIRSEIVLHASPWGQSGASERFTAFIVPPPPAQEPTVVPPDPGLADDFSAIRRTRADAGMDGLALDRTTQ